MKEHSTSIRSLHFIVVFFREYDFLNHQGASLCAARERMYALQMVVTWDRAPAFPFSLKNFLIPSPKQKLIFESFCCFHFPSPDIKTYSERDFDIIHLFA